jgi:hypothetical protein
MTISALLLQTNFGSQRRSTMIRSFTHALVATLGMWSGVVGAQDWDEAARAQDIRNHFDRDWNIDGHFDRPDAIQRTLRQGADPLRSNFGRTYAPYGLNSGVQNYVTPNYFGRYYGVGPYGGEFFPGQWYFQNRRYVSPYGGLYRYPSDRYFVR